MSAVIPILLIIWLAGLLASRTAGGFLHILPVAAAAIAIVLVVRWARTRGGSPAGE